MLARSLPSSALSLSHGSSSHSPFLDCVAPAVVSSTSMVYGISWRLSPLTQKPRDIFIPSKRWEVHSTAPTIDITLNNEETEKWASCREALSVFNFSIEEQDKILGKAFGQVHSPYWGEERKAEVPHYETVNEILEYLRSLSLSDDDLSKLLKKFPEVIGCSLENELKNNVQILEKQWGIKGKPLRNLLLRNPKVLGYNVDCKGDCIAQCTRCWVRF